MPFSCLPLITSLNNVQMHFCSLLCFSESQINLLSWIYVHKSNKSGCADRDRVLSALLLRSAIDNSPLFWCLNTVRILISVFSGPILLLCREQPHLQFPESCVRITTLWIHITTFNIQISRVNMRFALLEEIHFQKGLLRRSYVWSTSLYHFFSEY